MSKRSQRLALMNAENKASSKVSMARKLIHWRQSLHVLHDMVKAGKALTVIQDQERLYLVDAIGRAKKSLVKAGLSPALLANTELLKHYLKTNMTHLPHENFRSGGAGILAQGAPVKRWT